MNSQNIVQKSNERVLRVVIENVRPEVDEGRFPIKRTVGESVNVTADILAEGLDVLSARVLYRTVKQTAWQSTPMRPLTNDRWTGDFPITRQETHIYTLQAWPDAFKTWVRDLKKRSEAGQELAMEFLIGAELITAAASRAGAADGKRLQETVSQIREFHQRDPRRALEIVENEDFLSLIQKYPDLETATGYERELRVDVDRERARFGSWYEMFPRSCTNDSAKHATFRDCIQRLDYIAAMGFDILYLPPIHPIGEIERKGKNNSVPTSANDVGSPWAIGSKLGGHKAIHPQLGTLEDFRALLAEAKRRGIEIALDLAFQCAPDHPYVLEHKDWFRVRPDGSVQYAENPPKKYQDIFPLNFETESAHELNEELKSVVLYWIQQGVQIFRVDNPHTKPFAFWEWLIGEVRREYPDVLFLAEAFTRPKVMYRLAKLGFTQSYTYFAWRNTKWDLTEYFTELTQTDVREFFRPNLWPNTPDILTEYLQFGGRPSFMIRLCLAATLGASYGIYGPAFELFENHALRPGSEEYLDSEKYQIRAWEIERPDSLKNLIARINSIRKQNPALQSDQSLRFHPVDNEQLIAFSKVSADRLNIILVVVNLDPHHRQSGWVDLPLEHFRLEPHQEFQVHDLISEDRFLWQGSRNYVELDPQKMPAHIFRLRRRVRTEQGFDDFL
ncbi:MAG: alpha-1,4-glucan--maltose-1-phosphate maltosyltransferase [Candidatus Acidiferrales bacterium]